MKISICFISHEDSSLLKKTLPHNLYNIKKNLQGNLTLNTIILSNESSFKNNRDIQTIAIENDISEVRFRSSKSFQYGGDPSNNSHLNLLSNNTNSDILITIESDVIVNNYSESFSLVNEIINFFDEKKDVLVCFKMSDTNCWAWRKQKIENYNKADEYEYVNRLASHFLIYNMKKLRKTPIYSELLKDSYSKDFNYEDKLSNLLYIHDKPVIFLKKWPLSIWHCDRKLFPGSEFYTQNAKIKQSLVDFFMKYPNLKGDLH
ncbi:hypothetical protein [Bacillus velezensis]|uniref:hypothetical protein n=1 Tax=Bacillus velezensis TaxID=492670 RepID=UPI0039B0DE47